MSLRDYAIAMSRKATGSKLSTLGRSVVRGTAIACLLAHFSLTLLYSLPLNPLKMEYEAFLFKTIDRFFPQNWSLFAPNPVFYNTKMMVQCQPASGPTDPQRWDDITTPLIEHHQRNRFSSYERIARTQFNSIGRYLDGSPMMNQWTKACRDGSADACEVVKKFQDVLRGSAGRQIARIASSYCADTARADVVKVAVRAVRTEGRPWSQRDENPPEKSRAYDLGVYPMEAIDPPGLYQAEAGE